MSSLPGFIRQWAIIETMLTNPDALASLVPEKPNGWFWPLSRFQRIGASGAVQRAFRL